MGKSMIQLSKKQWDNPKLKEWRIKFNQVAITAPFNAIGFQMCPSRQKSEQVLSKLHDSEVIAYSILAAGYLKLPEALDYIARLPNLNGLVIGISKHNQAVENFKLCREKLPR